MALFYDNLNPRDKVKTAAPIHPVNHVKTLRANCSIQGLTEYVERRNGYPTQSVTVNLDIVKPNTPTEIKKKKKVEYDGAGIERTTFCVQGSTSEPMMVN